MMDEENHLRITINHRLKVVLIEEIDDEDRTISHFMLSFDEINQIWERINLLEDSEKLHKKKGGLDYV